MGAKLLAPTLGIQILVVDAELDMMSSNSGMGVILPVTMAYGSQRSVGTQLSTFQLPTHVLPSALPFALSRVAGKPKGEGRR